MYYRPKRGKEIHSIHWSLMFTKIGPWTVSARLTFDLQKIPGSFVQPKDYLHWMYDAFWDSAVIPWNVRSHCMNDSKTDEVNEQNTRVDFNVYVKFVKHLLRGRWLCLHLTGRTCGYLLQIATFICIYFYKVEIYKPYIHTYIFISRIELRTFVRDEIRSCFQKICF